MAINNFFVEYRVHTHDRGGSGFRMIMHCALELRTQGSESMIQSSLVIRIFFGILDRILIYLGSIQDIFYNCPGGLPKGPFRSIFFAD